MLQSLINFLFEPDWKRVIELHYRDNILSVTTYDEDVERYYHAINDATDHNFVWQTFHSRKTIRDKDLIKKLDGYYSSVLRGKRFRGGWVQRL